MVLVDKLPIFKQTYELVSLLLDYVASFPKVYRFTLGDKITNTSLALFEYI